MFVFVSDCIAKKSTFAMRKSWTGPVYGLRCPCKYVTVSRPGRCTKVLKTANEATIYTAKGMEKLL